MSWWKRWFNRQPTPVVLPVPMGNSDEPLENWPTTEYSSPIVLRSALRHAVIRVKRGDLSDEAFKALAQAYTAHQMATAWDGRDDDLVTARAKAEGVRELCYYLGLSIKKELQ